MNQNKNNLLLNQQFIFATIAIGIMSFLIYYYVFTNMPANQKGPHDGLFWAIGFALIGITSTIITLRQNKLKEEIQQIKNQLKKYEEKAKQPPSTQE